MRMWGTLMNLSDGAGIEKVVVGVRGKGGGWDQYERKRVGKSG